MCVCVSESAVFSQEHQCRCGSIQRSRDGGTQPEEGPQGAGVQRERPADAGEPPQHGAPAAESHDSPVCECVCVCEQDCSTASCLRLKCQVGRLERRKNAIVFIYSRLAVDTFLKVSRLSWLRPVRCLQGLTFVRLAGGEPEPLLPGALHRLLQRDRDALQEPPCGAGVQQHHRQPVGGLGQRAPPARPRLGRGSGGFGRAAAAGPAHLHHVQGEMTTMMVLLLLHLHHLPHWACSSPLSWASSSECAPLRRTAQKRSSCNRRRTETPTLRAPPAGSQWY